MKGIQPQKTQIVIFSWDSVRAFAKLLALAAFCALLYLKFFNRVEATKPAVEKEKIVIIEHSPPPREPEIERLSAFVDRYINAIFSPLEGNVTPIPYQELSMLRENMADANVNAAGARKEMLQTGIGLCDTLLAAIKEREKAELSLADTRAKAYHNTLQNPKKDEQEKKRFFEFTIKRRWSDNCKSFRDTTDLLYSRLRNKEREAQQLASRSLAASGQAPLPRYAKLAAPHEIQIPYGTLTLPKGIPVTIIQDEGAVVTVRTGNNQEFSVARNQLTW